MPFTKEKAPMANAKVIAKVNTMRDGPNMPAGMREEKIMEENDIPVELRI